VDILAEMMKQLYHNGLWAVYRVDDKR